MKDPVLIYPPTLAGKVEVIRALYAADLKWHGFPSVDATIRGVSAPGSTFNTRLGVSYTIRSGLTSILSHEAIEAHGLTVVNSVDHFIAYAKRLRA